MEYHITLYNLFHSKRMERKPSGEGREAKTTEELQMEEIKRLQMETRKRLRQNRRSFRKLATSSGPIAVKGSKPTTRTKEFKFYSKMKEHHVSGKSSAVNVTNFPSTLRSSSNADTYNPNFVSTSATLTCMLFNLCLYSFSSPLNLPLLKV